MPRVALHCAALFAPEPRKVQLRAILRDFAPATAPEVVMATPARFLRPDKVAFRGGAYANLFGVIQTLGDLCRARSLTCSLALSNRLDQLGPPTRLVLSHHTITNPGFEALSSRGIRVLHVKAGDLPGSTTFDPQGFSGWSSLSGRDVAGLDLGGATQTQIDEIYETMRGEILRTGLTKYAQSTAPEPDLPAPYVLVALQTIGDMVQRAAYIPMLEMLHQVVRTYAGSPFAVVIKRHPKCRSRKVSAAIFEVLARHSHTRLSSRPIHTLLAGATALFTVNSGVGSEAMVHGLPVYLFGRADYDPIAHKIRSPDDLAALASPPRPAVSDADLRAFHYFYRLRHQARGPEALQARLAAILDESFGVGQEKTAAAPG